MKLSLYGDRQVILVETPTTPFEATNKLYVDTAISNHADDFNLHLTPSQNTLLDSLTVSATQLNYTANLTSDIQQQLDNKLSLSGGTLTGALILAANPTTNLQAATKQYVDNSLTTNLANYLPLVGGTLTGALVLAADPTTNLQASTKQYTDTQVNTRVSKAGDTMTGPLVLSGDPIANLEAATKQYVDNSVASVTSVTTATRLATPRNINGTAFDGTADITTAKWGTARTITIGNTGKSIDGSANVAWTVTELVGYTPVNKAGDTISGDLVMGSGYGITLSKTPESPTDVTNKSYVDSLFAGREYKDPVTDINLVNDSLNTPPASPVIGDVYIIGPSPIGAWVGKDGYATYYDGSLWVFLQGRAVQAGDRFGVAITTATSVSSSLTSYDKKLVTIVSATPGAITYTEDTLTAGSSVLVFDQDSSHFGETYTYTDENDWVLTNTSVNLTAGSGLSLTGKVLNVNIGGGLTLSNNFVTVNTSIANGLYINTGVLGVALADSTLSLSSGGLAVSSSLTSVINDAVTKTGTSSVSGSVTFVSGSTLKYQNTPSTADDVTPKSYVDTQVAAKVSKAGDTMTGPLVLSGNPTTNLEAATKQYVDSSIAALTSVGEATKLATPRNINGTAFDGTADITIAEPTFAGLLTNYSTNDANSLTTAGVEFRHVTSGGSNNPTAHNNPILSLNYDASNTAQLATDITTNKWYVRTQNAGAWGAWDAFYKVSDASSASTPSTLVLRDASGDFSAGTITANLSGNASTATKLATARTINGASFDGTANITTVSWGTGRTITLGNTGKSVDGSVDVSWSVTEIVGYTPVNKAGDTMTGALVLAADPTANLQAATKQYVDTGLGTKLDATSTAVAATKLATSRNINGTAFDGTADITTAKWGTARTITLGNTGKSVDGSANVAWTVTELVGYTPVNKAGDTMEGALVLAGDPSADLQAATKQYVDAGLATKLNATAQAVDSAKLNGQVASYYTDIPARLGYTPVNKAGDTMTGPLILSGDPSLPLGAVTKQYVDSYINGLKVRSSVRLATTGPLSSVYNNGASGVSATLTGSSNGALVIDTVTPSVGDRVLVKDQINKVENGEYIVTQVGSAVTPFILTRSVYEDESTEIPGSYFFIYDGITNIRTGWVITVDDPSTFEVGTSNIYVNQFSGVGSIIAGDGLTSSGNVINVVTANSSRIVINPDSIDLATTGVVAGTYHSVAVDVYGRVTSGSNPTTLSGYGITDAYTKTYIDNELATKVNKAGDTMTGLLTLSSDPVGNLDAATKQYVDTGLATKLGSTAKAVDSDKLDGIDSTQFLRSDIDATAAGTVSFNKNIALTNSPVLSIPRPQGGGYFSDTATVTGAIKIQLPVAWTSAMLAFDIDIYNNVTDGSSAATITVGGYNNSSTSTWQDTSAQIVTSSTANFPTVSFGFDGTYCCVYIGDTTTVWNSPRIQVRDVRGAGSGAYNISGLLGTWVVSVVTVLGTISSTVQASLVASKANTLSTPRNINGSAFDGSTDITTATWGTARDITIGSTTKSVNGGSNVSWTVTDVVGYTPVNKAGDTMTGPLTLASDPTANLDAATKQYVDNLVTTLRQDMDSLVNYIMSRL